ncbi:hypothetical protein ABEB36_002130 [Hypothenemus hampei]|uniref:Rad50/SbcC-type AAA domain-containing protein n=1 Tax=Hypothenemus hampei TaxID=57062 RepID=A0ABD1F8A4_HYPHA
MSQPSQKSKKRKPLSQLEVEHTSGKPKRTRVVEGELPTCSRRAGTINYMILKNFMCHSLLEVDFKDNNISMVIGKNGSGKSALLTALIVGLGGKATLTNRGTSVKNFVKAGKTSGSIEIQLFNEGPMSYRPTVYGKTITVIRNLTVSGSGTYRIKADNGITISTHAKEIGNITQNLNIQVDNPVCLLTQDTSRNFLSNNDPKAKFSLFMRATKLETLENVFKEINFNKNECSKLLDDKKKVFKGLQTEIRKLKAKLDGHQQIVTLKERKLKLKNEMMWAQVKDSEDELKNEENIANNLNRKLEEYKENKTKNKDEIEEIEKRILDYERQLAELKNQLTIQKRPETDINQQLQKLRDSFMEAKLKKQSLAIEIDAKNKDAIYLQREIDNAGENIAKVKSQKKQRMEILGKLREKIKCGNERLEATRNELFQIKHDIMRKQEDAESLKREIRQINEELDRERANLMLLQKQSGNTLLNYGRYIPKVKEMIERYKNSFQYEPKGPLGAYMKLKDKKWGVAVEGFLGRGILNAFIVDNQRDGKILRDIFSKCLEGERQPTIITSKFINRKHNVQENLTKAPPGCECLYNAVIIDDIVVSNCIIDQLNTESILLIPNNEMAMQIMADRNRVPANCRQGLTMKGDKFFPDPNYKTYASSYHQARYLQVDSSEYLQQLRDHIGGIEKRKRSVQMQYESLQSDIQSHSLMKKGLEDKIHQLTMEKQQIQQKYDELSEENEPEIQNIQYMENELNDIKSTLNEKNAALRAVKDELNELKAKMNVQEELLAKTRNVVQALEERLWPLQEQIQQNTSNKKQLMSSKEIAKQKELEMRRKVENALAVVASKRTEVTSKTTNALKSGNRPSDLRGVAEISQEEQELKKNIERIEMESENIDEITEKYKSLVEKYQLASGVLMALCTDLEELNKAVELRQKHYKLSENYFITFMKHSFKKVLDFRQFKGTIKIDMEKKLLDLVVMPQQGSQGVTVTSNLSGGERSFSTVAFLYALWQCMDFPFYFLDEFDVYMDKLNRSKVIDILLHHANSKPDLQFVFLTPQDVSFLKQNVSILRLEDPERIHV